MSTFDYDGSMTISMFECHYNIMALVIDASHYPTGSLFSDCQGIALPQLVAMASSRSNVARQSGVSIVNLIAF